MQLKLLSTHKSDSHGWGRVGGGGTVPVIYRRLTQGLWRRARPHDQVSIHSDKAYFEKTGTTSVKSQHVHKGPR